MEDKEEAYYLGFKKQISGALDSLFHNVRKTPFGYFIASGKECDDKGIRAKVNNRRG